MGADRERQPAGRRRRRGDLGAAGDGVLGRAQRPRGVDPEHRAAAPHAPDPDRRCRDPSAVAPAARRAEPARVERRGEARPADVARPRGRRRRGLGPGGGPCAASGQAAARSRTRAQAPGRERGQRDALRVLGRGADPGDERPALQPERGRPPSARRSGRGRTRAPCRPGTAGAGCAGCGRSGTDGRRTTRRATRTGGVSRRSSRWKRRISSSSGIIRRRTRCHLSALDRGSPSKTRGLDAVEERVDAVEEQRPVLLVGAVEDVEEVASGRRRRRSRRTSASPCAARAGEVVADVLDRR